MIGLDLAYEKNEKHKEEVFVSWDNDNEAEVGTIPEEVFDALIQKLKYLAKGKGKANE